MSNSSKFFKTEFKDFLECDDNPDDVVEHDTDLSKYFRKIDDSIENTVTGSISELIEDFKQNGG